MHRAGVNTGPPGVWRRPTPLVPPISVLFVHSQASLFGFHPLPLGIWMCILVQCLLHFSLSLKYLHLGAQASAAGGPFALPFIASRRIFPKCLLVSANPWITKDLKLCNMSLLGIFYVSGFGRVGCYCFSISCLLSLKVQTRGGVPFHQQRCFPCR